MAEHRALYRKWRPKTFSDVVGQQAITAALCNQIIANKLGHAYLFTGTRGTGKTSCAKIFAKAVNCENRNGAEPCGTCEICVGVDNGSILDVVEIDAASNNSVDDIRSLRDEAAYLPSHCRYKIYIIDEVHMLSTSAFNALLKIMEEPPEHVIFILATTEIHKVPATILSRCQRYDFVRIAPQQISERLLYVAQQEGFTLEQSAADLIARLADGALRDALSILDTCASVGDTITEEVVQKMAGVTNKQYLFEISNAVGQKNIADLLGLVATLREQSIDVKRLTEELVHHYRNYILLCAKPNGELLTELPKEELAEYQSSSSTISESTAIFAVRRLATALDKMGRSPDPRIELELALFDLCIPQDSENTIVPATRKIPAETKEVKHEALKATTAPSNVVQPETKVEAKVDDTPPWELEVSSEPIEDLPIVAPIYENNAPIAEETPQIQSAMNIFSGSTAPEPTQPSAPQTEILVEGIEVFAPWQDIIVAMKTIDMMLYTYMKSSSAYFDGTRVLIDGGDMFRSFVKDYTEANEKIKSAIQQVTGTRYAIGPYQKNSETIDSKKTVDAQETIEKWAEKGVPISRS